MKNGERGIDVRMRTESTDRKPRIKSRRPRKDKYTIREGKGNCLATYSN